MAPAPRKSSTTAGSISARLPSVRPLRTAASSPPTERSNIDEALYQIRAVVEAAGVSRRPGRGHLARYRDLVAVAEGDGLVDGDAGPAARRFGVAVQRDVFDLKGEDGAVRPLLRVAGDDARYHGRGRPEAPA
jgi:hypothetical protein